MLLLLQVLEKHGPAGREVSKWPVVGQFSSVGSLGTGPDIWLCNEWLQSMATVAKGNNTVSLAMASKPPLQLVSSPLLVCELLVFGRNSEDDHF